MKEIRTRGDIILFIDEIHTLVGAGAAEGAIDAASILKPMLARGELQTVGATTLEEYRKYLEKDSALERRFQPVQVDEPTVADTIQILKGLKDRYEVHHKVRFTEQALVNAANLADRYIADRFLPDKAIDLIDEAGSRMRIQRRAASPEIAEIDEKVAEIRVDKAESVQAQQYERAAQLRDQERSLIAERSAKESRTSRSRRRGRLGDRRRRDRRGARPVDRHPGPSADRGRDRPPGAHGGRTPQAHRGANRRHRRGQPCHSPDPGRL